MTVFEKLFRYYPHKKDGFMYEFHYIEESEDGKRICKTLCKPELGVLFKEPKEGGDWTELPIKPTTFKSESLKKIGMAYESRDIVHPGIQMDDKRRVWIGILLKMIAEDMLYMDTPIHIEQKIVNNTITTSGWVWVEK